MKNEINFLKPKIKKLSSKTWKAKAWKVFSKYIRLRDCLAVGSMTHGPCYTCGYTYPIEDLDAGHFLQGRHNSVMFNELNVHAQCTGCNRFKHGNLIEYTLRIQKDYGPAILEDLRALNNVSKPMKAKDYQAIYETYKRKLDSLK